MKQRVFSGIQPSGESLHLGNYLGAIKGMLALQDSHDCIFAVVDYHAITVPYDPASMPAQKFNAIVEYMAAGLDPRKSILIIQSDVPEHTELAWLLGCIMPVSKLEQLPTYKDKKARQQSPTMGLLDYPVLMAADILIYKASLVPVGQDQLPHIEFAREVARKFNAAFGETFPEPQAYLTEGAEVPSLLGTGKMSKSVPGSFIALNDSPDQIHHKLAVAVTDPARQRRSDPGEPMRCNIYAIHRLYTPVDRLAEIADGCRAADIGCLECKAILAEEIIADLTPFRECRARLFSHPDDVRDALREGAKRARPLARATLDEVRCVMGLDRI
ncbi:MAG: tryptophan--tRNA ligase [Chloroflexi bacterium]|nr:tryptophan--tRNA ligase [Chloroflexota bacterium]